MTKVITINEIHRTVQPGQLGDKAKGIPAVKPVIQIIPPGTVISSEGEELKEFRRLKAVRDIRPGEKVGVAIDPDDNDTEMAAKIAAARAGVAEHVGEHAGNVDDAGTAKKAAAASKAAAKASDSGKTTTKATTKPAAGSSESTGGDSTDNLV